MGSWVSVQAIAETEGQEDAIDTDMDRKRRLRAERSEALAYDTEQRALRDALVSRLNSGGDNVDAEARGSGDEDDLGGLTVRQRATDNATVRHFQLTSNELPICWRVVSRVGQYPIQFIRRPRLARATAAVGLLLGGANPAARDVWHLQWLQHAFMFTGEHCEQDRAGDVPEAADAADLDKYFGDGNVTGGDSNFLREYFKRRLWEEQGDDGGESTGAGLLLPGPPADSTAAAVDEDEEFLTRADRFEYRYNFRCAALEANLAADVLPYMVAMLLLLFNVSR